MSATDRRIAVEWIRKEDQMGQEKAMSKEDVERIAVGFLEALGCIDICGADRFMSETFTYTPMMRSEGLPIQSPVDRAGVIQLMQNISRLFPYGIRHKILTVMVDGKYACVETEGFARLDGGLVYNNAYMFRVEVRDGRVQSAREYCDFLHTKQMLFPE